MDGRPLRLPAYAMRTLFPETVGDSVHQHLDVQVCPCMCLCLHPLPVLISACAGDVARHHHNDH